MFPQELDSDGLLVRRRRLNRLSLPVVGQIVTEELDVSTPEFQAIDEILSIAIRYRHPPEKVVEEMRRRFYRFFMQQKIQYNYTKINQYNYVGKIA